MLSIDGGGCAPGPPAPGAAGSSLLHAASSAATAMSAAARAMNALAGACIGAGMIARTPRQRKSHPRLPALRRRASRLVVHQRPVPVQLRRPKRLEPQDHRLDVPIREFSPPGRHLAAKTGSAFPDGLFERLPRVVPGMPGAVERRRRKSAIRARLVPLRRTLGVRAMAGRAVLLVEHRAARHLLRIG